MSSTEEEQQSCNIGEDNSNAPANSESTDQQQNVAAEMASSLARSAEISEELPHPTKDNDDNYQQGQYHHHHRQYYHHYKES